MNGNKKTMSARPRSMLTKSTDIRSNSKENSLYPTSKQLMNEYSQKTEKTSFKRNPKPLVSSISYKTRDNQIFKPTSKSVSTKIVCEDSTEPLIDDLSKPKKFIEIKPTPDPTKQKQELSMKFNSIERIDAQRKKIKEMTINDDDNTRKTFEEKVTRKVNFPVEKKIYKNLIPLVTTEKKKPPSTNSNYEFFTIREREPKLEDYYTPESTNEHAATAKITLPQPSAIRQYDGHNIHRRILSWQMIIKLDKYI